MTQSSNPNVTLDSAPASMRFNMSGHKSRAGSALAIRGSADFNSCRIRSSSDSFMV